MINRILLPLDGSDFAANALPYAQALAEKFSAELILMRAADRHPALAYDDDAEGYIDLITQQKARAQTYLDNMETETAVSGLNVRSLFVDNDNAAAAILDSIQTEAVDMVVMSTHGRSGISRFLNGSVAERVMRHAHVPVLMIRPTPVEPYDVG